MELETPRLLLREFREEEWRLIAAFQSSPRARQFLLTAERSETAVYNFVMAALAHAELEPRHYYGLAVVHKDSGRFIGCATAGQIASEIPDARVGWSLDEAFWGQGYMTEAMRPLVAFGFESAGFASIVAYCFTANIASRRVMEKLGMQLKTPKPWQQRLLSLGHWERRPIVHYSLTKEQWTEGRKHVGRE
jgi:RimJ/RimL family protein N-acetyltransferase